MVNVTADPDVLSRLHRILRQHQDLMGRIRRVPMRASAARKLDEESRQRLEDLKASLKKSRMAAEQKQLQLNEREARVQNLVVKRNTCETNREYQLLSDQIAADEQANSVQGDEILELLERLDALQGQILDAGGQVEGTGREVARIQAEVDAELALLQQDLQSVRSELMEAEKSLVGEVRDRFRRLVETMGENALARVEDHCCGNCNTMLVAQAISDLMLQRPVYCRSCGSQLYIPRRPE